MSKKVLLFKVTSLTTNLEDSLRLKLEGKAHNFHNSGLGKEFATSFTPDFSVVLDAIHGWFQKTSIFNGELIITKIIALEMEEHYFWNVCIVLLRTHNNSIF